MSLSGGDCIYCFGFHPWGYSFNCNFLFLGKHEKEKQKEVRKKARKEVRKKEDLENADYAAGERRY